MSWVGWTLSGSKWREADNTWTVTGVLTRSVGQQMFHQMMQGVERRASNCDRYDTISGIHKNHVHVLHGPGADVWDGARVTVCGRRVGYSCCRGSGRYRYSVADLLWQWGKGSECGHQMIRESSRKAKASQARECLVCLKLQNFCHVLV